MISIVEGGKLSKSEKFECAGKKQLQLRPIGNRASKSTYSILATKIDYEENCQQDEKVVAIVDGTGGKDLEGNMQF